MIEIQKHCDICNRRHFATFVPKQYPQSIVAACIECGNMMRFECFGVAKSSHPEIPDDSTRFKDGLQVAWRVIHLRKIGRWLKTLNEKASD